MSVDLHLVAKGLGARLADLHAALERYDGFAFRPDSAAGEPAVDDAPGTDAQADARALVLRALRVVSDPASWALLARLRSGDTTTAALGRLVGEPRLATWERVNDLVQTGLAARSLDGDRVGLTAAGEGLVDLVEELARAITEGAS